MNLMNDLKPIEQQLIQNKEALFITHDSEKCIHVHCSMRFKAYIPKKYDGWEVVFHEIKPSGDPELDLDLYVSTF